METKYTPGPWAFIDATKEASMQYSDCCVIRAGQKQIASFSWHEKSPWFPVKAESQANARLIAAAPELLEALQTLTAKYGRIAFAVGSGMNPRDADWEEGDKILEAARAAINKATGA